MRNPRSVLFSSVVLVVPLALLLAAIGVPHPRAGAAQDSTPPGLGGAVPYEEGRWRFSELVYRPENDATLHRVQAGNLERVWMIVRPDGGTMLELLFDNGDYKLVHAAEVLFRNRSADAAAREVPVFRRPLDGMAFPTLQ